MSSTLPRIVPGSHALSQSWCRMCINTAPGARTHYPLSTQVRGQCAGGADGADMGDVAELPGPEPGVPGQARLALRLLAVARCHRTPQQADGATHRVLPLTSRAACMSQHAQDQKHHVDRTIARHCVSYQSHHERHIKGCGAANRTYTAVCTHLVFLHPARLTVATSV